MSRGDVSAVDETEGGEGIKRYIRIWIFLIDLISIRNYWRWNQVLCVLENPSQIIIKFYFP